MKTTNLTTERVNLLLSALQDIEAWKCFTAADGREEITHRSGVRLSMPHKRCLCVDNIDFDVSGSELERLSASFRSIIRDIEEARKNEEIKRKMETLDKAFEKLACKAGE